MKKFKKLIPALCMLLISAVTLGSSTFAWFSMNNKVTANGMQVEAASNTQFLVISQNTTFAGLNEVALVKTDGYGDGNKVLPIRYNSSANDVTVKEMKDNGTQDIQIPSKDWYTAFSTSYSAATGLDSQVVGVKKITEGSDEFKKYVLQYTGYIGLAAGSTENTNTFNVKATITDGNGNSTCALVILKQNGAETTERFAFDNVSNSRNNEISGTTNFTVNASTTDQKYVEITVYVYVDGQDASIRSDGFTATSGLVKLEFTMNGIAA